ncbi:LOW QUALITY PROTEIN: hypothetical protein CVT26_007739 [Gymnopilus dilepis]|uniref:Uncharacterized protein n=1 Tax=Gymnopilus dilepis TaxID=231916 RepID=A0A409WLI2_9AGAR|nr:LOW QUALITY PROTEIN: hypothetical protein CVT26_007739 [Gymnopilus dilepis]
MKGVKKDRNLEGRSSEKGRVPQPANENRPDSEMPIKIKPLRHTISQYKHKIKHRTTRMKDTMSGCCPLRAVLGAAALDVWTRRRDWKW